MVAKVCFPFVGDTIGGSHVSALLLIDALDRTRYQPVIVLHERGALAELLDARSIAYEFLPVSAFAGASPKLSRIVGSALAAAPRLRRFLRAHRVGIVHCNDLRTNLTWSLAARLAAARFVWHQRTRPFSRSPVWRLVPWLADRVVFISQATRNALPPMPDRKASVIANPFDVEETPPDRRSARRSLIERLGIPEDAAVIGYVGRFVQQKRPDLFIDIAAAIAREAGRDCAFVMLAPHEADEEARLVARANALGIAGKVHFAGFQMPIAPWLAAFDLLIAPAFGDGFGRAIVECMLVGTPAVASNTGGHPEIIEPGETGQIVDDESPAEYAAEAGDIGGARIA